MDHKLSWLMLLAAGVLEIVFAWGLKSASDAGCGATQARIAFIALTLAAMAGSLALLSGALRQLPIGTAYAVWSGIGAAGTAVVGMLLLGEAASAARLGCIGLIVGGVIGLRWASS